MIIGADCGGPNTGQIRSNFANSGRFVAFLVVVPTHFVEIQNDRAHANLRRKPAHIGRVPAEISRAVEFPRNFGRTSTDSVELLPKSTEVSPTVVEHAPDSVQLRPLPRQHPPGFARPSGSPPASIAPLPRQPRMPVEDSHCLCDRQIWPDFQISRLDSDDSAGLLCQFRPNFCHTRHARRDGRIRWAQTACKLLLAPGLPSTGRRCRRHTLSLMLAARVSQSPARIMYSRHAARQPAVHRWMRLRVAHHALG